MIGHIRLDRLRVSDVQGVFDAIGERNDLIARARESGDPGLQAQVKGARVVGPATMHRIRATLRAALHQAIKERHIDLNVASLIELPSGRRPKALVWTSERVREWRQARQAFINAKSRTRSTGAAAAPEAMARSGRVKPMDAYVSTPRPSPVMVWTPEQTGIFVNRAAGHRLYGLYHLIAFRDGIDHGSGVTSSINPVGSCEGYEREIPYLCLYRRELPASGGHGQWRGGATFTAGLTGHHTDFNHISSGGLFQSVTQGIGLAGAPPVTRRDDVARHRHVGA